MNWLLKEKIITPIVSFVLCIAIMATTFAVTYSSVEDEKTQKKSPSELYKLAVVDAMEANESEIEELFPINKDSDMVRYNDYENRILLLSWHKYPESYLEGQEIALSYGNVFTFTDKEIAKWFNENKEGVTDWNLRFSQLIGLPPENGYTHFTAFWAKPEDIIRPAYVTNIEETNMTISLSENESKEYTEWFYNNILNSYYLREYPWTRLGYTYDWADNGTEFGLSEFIINKDSDVFIEFTKTNDEFIEWLNNYESYTPKYANMEEKPKKLRLISYGTPILDGSYNELYWNSFKTFQEKSDVAYEESENYEGFVEVLDQTLSEQPDFVFITDAKAGHLIEEKAAENENVIFAVADKKFENPQKNVLGLVFCTWESSFLAGFTAAKSTKTGSIAFIGGIEDEVTADFESGFVKGAKFANNDVTIMSEYIGSCSDSEKAKQIAQSLYEKNGVDVIFQVAGDAGVGVIEAAKYCGKFVIGTDDDQTESAPKNILTNVVKNFDVAVKTVLNDVLNEKDIGGQNYMLDLKSGAVNLAPNNGNIDEKLYNEIVSVKKKIIDKIITVSK